MTAPLSVAKLKNLVRLVASGNVVPIVGEDFLTIETPEGPRRLGEVLAERLKSSLGLEPEDGATLSDVAAAFLKNDRSQTIHGVREELATIVKEEAATWVPAEPLRQLASIDAFNLFLTTGLDPLLAGALRAARRVEPAIGAFTSDAKEKDLPYGWSGTSPLVYHLFGAASNPSSIFAVTEEETLEGLLLLNQCSPERLMDKLRTSHLLLLGCRFPDGLSRLFLRIARGKRLDDRRGETELIAGADETDALLVRFLARFSKHTEVLPVTASTLVAALAGIWRDKRPAPAAAEATAPLRSIFVSYADADAAAARALADALTERGLDVWLDKGDSPDALQPGDTFDRIISEQIAGCELFVPVLSQRAVARVEGYFRTEWELAVERQLGIARNVAFLVPVRVDDVPKDDPGIPQVMRKRHWVEMPGGKANDAVVAHFVKTVRTVRALRKGGAT